MNCADFERLIALDAEGDLPKQMAASVTAHLRTCRQCQEFAAKLETSQSLLKELGQEAPDEATLQQVRRGILNRLPNEPAAKSFPVWRWAFAAALVAMLIFTILVLRRPSRTAAPGAMAKDSGSNNPGSDPAGRRVAEVYSGSKSQNHAGRKGAEISATIAAGSCQASP